MRRCLGTQTGYEIGGTENSAHRRFNALIAKALRGVESGDSETDVADVAVGGKVLVSEYDVHWGGPLS
jgi:hypothetical protein